MRSKLLIGPNFMWRFALNNYCTHGFNLFFVESAAVQKQCVDGVARPGCLNRRGCHIQEVLGRNMTQQSGKTGITVTTSQERLQATTLYVHP